MLNKKTHLYNAVDFINAVLIGYVVTEIFESLFNFSHSITAVSIFMLTVFTILIIQKESSKTFRDHEDVFRFNVSVDELNNNLKEVNSICTSTLLFGTIILLNDIIAGIPSAVIFLLAIWLLNTITVTFVGITIIKRAGIQFKKPETNYKIKKIYRAWDRLIVSSWPIKFLTMSVILLVLFEIFYARSNSERWSTYFVSVLSIVYVIPLIVSVVLKGPFIVTAILLLLEVASLKRYMPDLFKTFDLELAISCSIIIVLSVISVEMIKRFIISKIHNV